MRTDCLAIRGLWKRGNHGGFDGNDEVTRCQLQVEPEIFGEADMGNARLERGVACCEDSIGEALTVNYQRLEIELAVCPIGLILGSVSRTKRFGRSALTVLSLCKTATPRFRRSSCVAFVTGIRLQRDCCG